MTGMDSTSTYIVGSAVWVEKDIQLDKVCEECNQEREDVIPNLMTLGFKICESCKLSKTIFPV